MVYELDIGWPGLSVKQELLNEHAGSIPVVHPKYPCDETGKHAGLKILCLGLWVRLPPGIQLVL
jgi:hypothetical protein